MDWLQFTAAIVGSIAWPAVALVLIIILRKHIGALADRLDKFSFGGAEFSFKELLATGAEIIEEAPVEDSEVQPKVPDGAPPPSPPEYPMDLGRHKIRDSDLQKGSLRGRELWDTTGAGQIINSYERVNDELRDIGEALGVSVTNERAVIDALVQKEAIRRDTANLYKTLRDGRNLIAHARALPSESETLEYVRQATYLQSLLQAVKAKIKREIG
jgi:hypothetical protein